MQLALLELQVPPARPVPWVQRVRLEQPVQLALLEQLALRDLPESRVLLARRAQPVLRDRSAPSDPRARPAQQVLMVRREPLALKV